MFTVFLITYAFRKIAKTTLTVSLGYNIIIYIIRFL